MSEPQKESKELTKVDNPFGKSVDMAQRHSAMIDIERERAITEVQAAITVAKKFPRDQRLAMDAIINECTLPTLAEVATYDYVRGGEEISGPTIRLAEVVARSWGNIEFGVRELARHDGVDGQPGYSDCQAFAWDLQTMTRDIRTFPVKHWRSTKKGGYALTDERDIYETVANLGARRKRACIESIIPKSVFAAALHQCALTLKTTVEVNDETVKRMLEKLEPFGITQEMIEKRIQRRVREMLPQQMVKLGHIYNSLTQEMSRVSDWFDVPDGAEPKPVEQTKSGRKKPAAKPKEEPKGNDQTGATANGLPAGEGSPDTAGGIPAASETPAQQQTQVAPDPTAIATPAQLALIKADMEILAINGKDICKQFGVAKLEDLRAIVVPAVLKWMANPIS